MVNILVSACLLGHNCKYNGKNNKKELNFINYKVYSFCPEVQGGLSIPRIPCEIIGDKVISKENIDCTEEYTSGAYKCLNFCKENNITIAVLKEKSPSCGVKYIYDGTFSSKLISGMGITTRLLQENGIKVYSELEWEEFNCF